MKPSITLCGLVLACRLSAGQWFAVRMDGPLYPPLANQARIEGVVTLHIALSATGEVLTVEVVSGNSVLAKEARANALMWAFARRCPTDEALPRTVEMTYEFRLNGEVLSNPKTQFHYEHPYRVVVVSQALHWTPQTAK